MPEISKSRVCPSTIEVRCKTAEPAEPCAEASDGPNPKGKPAGTAANNDANKTSANPAPSQRLTEHTTPQAEPPPREESNRTAGAPTDSEKSEPP